MTEPELSLLTAADTGRIRVIADIHGRLPPEWGDDGEVSEVQIRRFAAQLEAGLSDGRTHCETVEIAGQLVAFLWAEILKDAPNVVNILSLWTAKEHRRKGIALRLKTRMEAWARERDVARILTGVDHAGQPVK